MKEKRLAPMRVTVWVDPWELELIAAERRDVGSMGSFRQYVLGFIYAVISERCHDLAEFYDFESEVNEK